MEIRKLNSIRALAALIVLITHFSDATGWLDGKLGGRAGQYGVMLFFLLSGFLMSYLYLAKDFNFQSSKNYIVARIARVIPLFFLLVFLSYTLEQHGWHGLYSISEWHQVLSHLMFLKGESVLWSIAPEVQFYLIFVGLWFITAWKHYCLYFVVISSLIIILFSDFPRPTGSVYGLEYDLHLFRSLPYFLVGVLFGKHYRSLSIPNNLMSQWFVLALILIPLLYPKLSPLNSATTHRMWLNYEILLVMSTVFFTIVYLVPDKSLLLSNPIGDFVGKISYSLYLLHMPLLPVVTNLAISVEWQLILFILISVTAAFCSYHLVEKPAAKWIRKLIR